MRRIPFLPLVTVPALALAASAQGHSDYTGALTVNDFVTAGFRTIDGSGNNMANPSWGAADTQLLRLMTVDYGDGLSTPAGSHRASAREVSNAVVAQIGSVPNSASASDIVWQWGQFLDHDIDLTEGHSPAEPFDIMVPLGDPFFDPMNTGTQIILLNRSFYDAASMVRQQMNQITSFIDASNVYGSDAAREAELRGFGGVLKTSPGRLLPFNVNGFPNAPTANDPTFYLAGDVRANEQIGLTAMHTLWVREHNFWVAVFRALGFGEEDRYQLARAMVGAEMQVITYREFLPVILGPSAIPAYAGYDANVNAGISNEFSTAAYRFGHTMLSPVLRRTLKNGGTHPAGDVPLSGAFFNPAEFQMTGIEPILRGLAGQQAQEVDAMIVDAVRNFLFGPPGAGGFDLASLNIQRGRDHGLASYNQARVDKGLAAATSFADVSSDPIVQVRLSNAYASVDDIDLWVGGLAEDHVPGALVGELFWNILRDEFVRLRDGDRYWYQNNLTPLAQLLVQNVRLSDVMRRNTNIRNEISGNVFLVN